MIHYNHNNNKHTNIKLNKAKRHAVAHYRHTQRVNKAKTFASNAAATLLMLAIMAVGFMFIGLN